jgi:hypothetical protein
MDVAPFAPKGNNNNGSDVEKTSLQFARTDLTGHNGSGWAGRASRAFTGAGRISSVSAVEHTTHNGQLSGIVDVNGNQWTIAPGLTSVTTSMSAAGYRLLPSSVAWSTIASNTNIRDASGVISLAAAPTVTAGSFVTSTIYRILTAGDTDFTLVGAANSDVGTIFTATGAGTGTGTAIAIDEGIWHTAANAYTYLVPHAGGTFHPSSVWASIATLRHMAELGIPREQGTNTTQGTTGVNIFGGDGFYRSLTADCLPLVGGGGTDPASAGVFARLLLRTPSLTRDDVGARAVRLLSA